MINCRIPPMEHRRRRPPCSDAIIVLRGEIVKCKSIQTCQFERTGLGGVGLLKDVQIVCASQCMQRQNIKGIIGRTGLIEAQSGIWSFKHWMIAASTGHYKL